MKVAYNACFGGFGLSHAGIMRYAELKGIKLYAFIAERLADGSLVPFSEKDKMRPISDAEAEKALIVHYSTTPEYSNDTCWSVWDLRNDRADPVLIQVIEELGPKANGRCANLKIEEVAKGTLWRIDEYDGNESIATQDSYNWNVAT